MSAPQEIILSDLSECHPAAALSSRRRRRHWQLISYQTEHFAGTMLSAGPMTEAPEVRLDLKLEGWHAIFIGMWAAGRSDTRYALSTEGADNVGSIRVRLDSDPCFTMMRREQPGRTTLEEAFWKHADLSARTLIVSQQNEGFRGDSSLAYVRLVPLSRRETVELVEDRRRTDTKRLIATNDAFGIFFRGRITSREGIWEHVEPYRHTDFGKLFWEVVAGMFGGWRPSGKLYGDGVEDFPRTGDVLLRDSIRTLVAKGINPLQAAMDHAHGMGLEFHVSQRTEMFQNAPPFEEVYSTDFYAEHPQYRLRDRDGTEITGLSYAFPEVRAYLIGLFEQAVSLGADGAAVIYPRSAPYVLYEEPVVSRFRAQHGADPREVDAGDERLLGVWAEFMTRYMRELRQTLDAVGTKLGKRLELSAITFATEAENRRFGIDPAAWIRAGCVDALIAYPCLADHSFCEIDAEHYAGLTRDSPCKLYMNVMPRHMSAREYRERAVAYYDAGADGLLFWDTYQRHDATSQWAAVRRLGHLEELRSRVERAAEGAAQATESEPRLLTLRMLGGHSMLPYSPYRGA
jgi:hypothetical protein